MFARLIAISIFQKCLSPGYSFDKIKDELYLGERTVINLYNDFIIEITLLAIKNGLIHI